MNATESASTATTPPRRRRLHPAVRAAIVVLCVLAALVVIDTGVRLFLQWRIAASVSESLPPGVEGNVGARVHGFSAVWQLASGSLEHVELSAPELTVLGVPIAARVDGYGVRFTDGPVPVPTVDELTGELRIGQDALNRLVPVPGAEGGVTLGEGNVGYETTLSLLGLTVDVRVEAAVGMRGDRLVIEATSLQVVSGPLDVDAADLLGDATTIAIPLCTSTYLPIGLHLTAVDVSPGEVRVSVAATGFTLDESTLGSRGACR